MNERIRIMIALFAAAVLGFLLSATVAESSDYTVTRSVRIDSERPIAWLILEMGLGVLNGNVLGRNSATEDQDMVGTDRAGVLNEYDTGLSGERISRLGETVEFGSTILSVDGHEQPGRTSALAAWRLLGFILWDADGTVERVTDIRVAGHSVRIRDVVSNGRVWVRVTIGPPLGDPRVRCARLTLTAQEKEHVAGLGRAIWDCLTGGDAGGGGRILASGCVWRGAGYEFGDGARVQLSCSAEIDLPCDRRRDRVHARRERWGCDRPTWSEGKGEERGAPELASRVNGLADAGRGAVLAGRGEIDAVVAEFIERVCGR